MTLRDFIMLIAWLLALGVVVWVVQYAVRTVFQLQDPLARVIIGAVTIIACLMALLAVLSFLGVIAGGPLMFVAPPG